MQSSTEKYGKIILLQKKMVIEPEQEANGSSSKVSSKLSCLKLKTSKTELKIERIVSQNWSKITLDRQ